MNIRIGDMVRFLTEKLEGKVTAIVDHSTVNVYVDEYGFEIPASVNDLVVIRTDFEKAPLSGHAVPGQKAVPTVSSDTIYLALVPDNFHNLTESRYDLYVVNDTEQTCLFSVSFCKDNQYTGILAGNCSPDSTCPIGTYSLKEIDTNIKSINIQAIFFRKGKTALKKAVETEIKINPPMLCKSGSYKHSRWFEKISILKPLEQKHLIITEEINEKELEEAIKEKKTAEKPAPYRNFRSTNSNLIEIDLHCRELLETTAGMDNKDILEYQLETFRKTMEEYKLRRGQKIVFIHGKGDGILRQRIQWELQTKYKRHHHQDASFKQYGYGATLVTIK